MRRQTWFPSNDLALCMVVAPQKNVGEAPQLAGLFAGTPEAAWCEAANLSDKLHIVYKKKPFHTGFVVRAENV